MTTKRAHKTTKKHITLLLAAIVSLAVFAVACGGDSGETSSATSPTTTSPASASDASSTSGSSSSSSPTSGSTSSGEGDTRASSVSTQDPTPDPTGAPESPTTTAPPPIDSDLPDVSVLRVSTGEELTISSLAPASRPLLLWFWAPH